MSPVYSPPPSVRVPSYWPPKGDHSNKHTYISRVKGQSKHVYAVKHPKEALCRGYPARHGGRFRGRLSADESEIIGSFLSLNEYIGGNGTVYKAWRKEDGITPTQKKYNLAVTVAMGRFMDNVVDNE
nr:hypothetical protein [Tanacetum cinerariifolium]